MSVLYILYRTRPVILSVTCQCHGRKWPLFNLTYDKQVVLYADRHHTHSCYWVPHSFTPVCLIMWFNCIKNNFKPLMNYKLVKLSISIALGCKKKMLDFSFSTPPFSFLVISFATIMCQSILLSHRPKPQHTYFTFLCLCHCLSFLTLQVSDGYSLPRLFSAVWQNKEWHHYTAWENVTPKKIYADN